MDARLRRVNKEIAGRVYSDYCTVHRVLIVSRFVNLNVFDWPWYNNVYITDCKSDKTSNINIDLVDNSPFHLKGSFLGPEGTPYEGGHFAVVSS